MRPHLRVSCPATRRHRDSYTGNEHAGHSDPQPATSRVPTLDITGAAFVARGVCADLLEHCVREHEPATSAAILDAVRRNLVAKIRVTVSQADQTVKPLCTRLRSES